MSSFFSLLILLAISACSKNSNNPDAQITPANLVINATVSSDNSGNVSFVSTATNAVSYEYDFGNGSFQNSTDGKASHKYTTTGGYTVKVTAKSRTGETLTQSTEVQVTVALQLVWADEFNVDGAPDAGKWNYDIGTGSGGWGNNEAQYYTSRSENVIVSGGTLKITAKKEAYSGSQYTSARLLTKNKFSTKYGRIEARIKLPTGVGTWPAFWMLGSNIDQVSWPACGEIDIMEHKGSDEGRIYGTLHYPGRSGGNADGKTTNVPNVASSFHVYTADWTDKSIRISVDGREFYSFINTSSTPFNQPFFILLNFAMGGTFGGPIDPAYTSSVMEVDYVRVYN